MANGKTVEFYDTRSRKVNSMDQDLLDTEVLGHLLNGSKNLRELGVLLSIGTYRDEQNEMGVGRPVEASLKRLKVAGRVGYDRTTHLWYVTTAGRVSMKVEVPAPASIAADSNG